MLVKNIFIFLILVLFFSSCSKKEEKISVSNSKFTIKDDLGIEVSFDEMPKRIISMAPNITEGLYAIGAQDYIVGVTEFCDYPPEAKQKTKVGGYDNANYEMVAALKPDVVFITVESINRPMYQALQNLGIKMFVLNAKNVDGVAAMLKNLGKLTGKEKEAELLGSNLLKQRDSINAVNNSSGQKKCLVIVGTNPVMTASKRSYINEIMMLSGLDNVYAESTLDYPTISYEDIAVKDPSYILLPYDTTKTGKLKVETDELSKSLSSTEAVKKSNFIVVDNNVVFRPGPRVIEAVRIIRSKVW
ncbi:MAG: ABC transporter substrate-binding protein [Ignavibacteria bacterium]|nr:ABC transporter substrate-binding protein [Ignavibacteria bacterium]